MSWGALSGPVAMKVHSWDKSEREELGPLIVRRVIHSERMTTALFDLKKGAVVPRHSHDNEQMSHVLAGRALYLFDDRDIAAGPGEVVEINSHEPHRVEALEDSSIMDVFQPVRTDWLKGGDTYLRNPSEE